MCSFARISYLPAVLPSSRREGLVKFNSNCRYVRRRSAEADPRRIAASLRAIDYLLGHLKAVDDVRCLRWRCVDCGYIKHFTRPAALPLMRKRSAYFTNFRSCPAGTPLFAAGALRPLGVAPRSSNSSTLVTPAASSFALRRFSSATKSRDALAVDASESGGC